MDYELLAGLLMIYGIYALIVVLIWLSSMPPEPPD